MQQEQKCKCCGSTMEMGVQERCIPVYDDGGSIDAMDILIEHVEYCSNDACGYGIKTNRVTTTYYDCDDDLPF